MAGSIRPGKRDGTWELRVRLGVDPANPGRYAQKSVTIEATSRRAAERALAKLVAEVEDGKHSPTAATVQDAVELHIHRCESVLQRSPTTVASYRWLSTLIYPRIGDVKVGRLEPLHLEAAYASMLDAGLAAGTVRHAHALLRAALATAVTRRWVTSNVATFVRPPSLVRPELSVPSPETVRTLIGAAAPHLKLWLRLAASTGARRGEICGLRRGDFDGCQVRVRRAVVQVNGQQVLVKDTKGGQPKTIPLDAATVELVAAAFDELAARAKLGGVALVADPYLFSDDLSAGRPWRPDRVTLAWCRLRNREGFPNVRLHDLRHFMVTELLASGVDARTVADRAGHASTKMTLDVYASAVESKGVAAGDAMGRLLD